LLAGRFFQIRRRIINQTTQTRSRQVTAKSAKLSFGSAADNVADSASRAASTQSAAQVTRSASSHSELANTLAELNVSALGKFVAGNKIDLWPYLCGLIPDSAFCWQELGEAPLQSDGTFSAEICFWCPSDFPDLYFEVIQNYDGNEIEISDPQIACSTYYGYGSQSVDIIVDDPRAVACPPTYTGPSGLFVHPLGFYETSLADIIDLETDVTFSSPNKGKVPKGAPIGGIINAPWGGTLPLKMDYHQGMFGYYYRLSYRFDSDGGGTDFSRFTPVTTVVDHYYRVWDDITTFTGHWERFNLGPKTVVRPGDGVSVTNLYAFPNKTLDWRFLYDADIMFGYFDSTGGVTDPPGWNTDNINRISPRDTADGISAHKGGMVTLLLEVFDSNGNFVPCNNSFGTANWGDPAGGEVTPVPAAFEFLLPPLGGPPDGFAPAPLTNITDHGRLIFRILVNNNYTVAKLNDVTDAGGSATPCGFLNFSSLDESVSIGYVARHPQDYLDSSMSIVRGLCGQADGVQQHGSNPATASPPALEAHHVRAAKFLLGVDPAAACGNCPDGAAFAVNLYTYAWATDGRYRQSQYDDSDTIAFALLKPC
jgi:hypothetical protein